MKIWLGKLLHITAVCTMALPVALLCLPLRYIQGGWKSSAALHTKLCENWRKS